MAIPKANCCENKGEKSPQRLHLCEAVGWIRDFSDWAATAGLSEPEKQVDLGRTD